MLEKTQLEEMTQDTIFARGETSVEDYWDTAKEMQIMWGAVTLHGSSWIIYYQLAKRNWSDDVIRISGETMRNPQSIKKCLPCSDEAFTQYNCVVF